MLSLLTAADSNSDTRNPRESVVTDGERKLAGAVNPRYGCRTGSSAS
jgi:hypothetical protein